MKKSITIGIPAYNESSNIMFLLSSLLSQKRDNFRLIEIIVILDGSTDDTEEKVKNVRSKYVRVIVGKERLGQNARQNQILKMMSSKSDALLFVEADSLPTNNRYISNLVSSIPPDGKYSIIVADSVPYKSTTFIGKTLAYGFRYKHDLFEKAMSFPNLYLCTLGLFSVDFLKRFKWANDFHDDSYAYRMAINSRLPIIRSKKSKLYFKTVENFRDHIFQSGKFQKARNKENEYSDVYKVSITDYKKLIQITLEYFLNNPVVFLTYFAMLITARLFSIFLPKYNSFWKTYESSKLIKKTL